jgi:hypothetical protein
LHAAQAPRSFCLRLPRMRPRCQRAMCLGSCLCTRQRARASMRQRGAVRQRACALSLSPSLARSLALSLARSLALSLSRSLALLLSRSLALSLSRSLALSLSRSLSLSLSRSRTLSLSFSLPCSSARPPQAGAPPVKPAGEPRGGVGDRGAVAWPVTSHSQGAHRGGAGGHDAGPRPRGAEAIRGDTGT